MAHREGQISLILPALSVVGWFFLSQEASVLVQKCKLGTLGSGLGKSLTSRRDHAGWQLGTYLLESLLPVGPLQVAYSS